MQTVNFDFVRGDTFNKVVQFRDNANVPINITSWSNMLAEVEDIDGNEITGMTISIVDATTGMVRLVVAAEVTALLTGCYLWDFQRTVNGELKTMMGGYFNASADIAVV